jgi:FkbM family methyltransferase
MQALIKRFVDTCTPSVGLLYREFREKRRLSRPSLLTPLGVILAADKSIQRGEFEQDELQLFLDLLTKSSVCIDIGAHIGLYSCLAATRGKYAIAVEPLASNLTLLYRNLLANGLYDVEVYPVGLASKPGLRRLFGGGTGASFIAGWAATPERWSRMVPVTTLDVILGARFTGAQLVIKMDVEGFELEVLRGAQQALSMDPRPKWLVEICLNQLHCQRNKEFEEIFEVFWRNGYVAKTATTTPQLISREDVERWLHLRAVDFGSHNYLFVSPRD